MMSPAGHLFSCVVCRGDYPEDIAFHDEQLAGPICPECKYRCFKAVVLLKKEGIGRPINLDDINQSNCKRFL